MTNFAAGRQAEESAAKYLTDQKYKIKAQNWRTRHCEIDIIAERRGAVYFCEVKYRQNAAQGTGLDYITPKKIEQMRYAAEIWIAQNDWNGECELCAIEVSGPEFTVTKFIKDLY